MQTIEHSVHRKAASLQRRFLDIYIFTQAMILFHKLEKKTL